MNNFKSTDKEKIMQELEILLRPVLINSKGVNYGPDNKPIKAVDLQKCEMLEIENYKGYSIKVIVG